MNRLPHQPKSHISRCLLIFLCMVLTTGLACNLPFIGPDIEETPTPAPTPRPVLGVVEPSPPTIIETWPLPQGILPVQGRLSLTFDQAMERGSVEGALRLQPVYAGRFEWVDDFTVQFVPDRSFPVESQIDVTIAETARAENGLTLLRPATFSFRTPGGLYVTERLPKPDSEEVNPTSAVVVTFNRPIVPLGEDERLLPSAFDIVPAVEGSGKWLNTSTYLFSAYQGLAGGVSYTVDINPELMSLDGTPLSAEETLSWSFRTANPALIEVLPASGATINLDDSISLIFNQSMDTNHVEANLYLRDAGGNAVPVMFEWAEQNAQVTITPLPLLARNAFYTLELANVRSRGGSLLGNQHSFSYRTVGPMAVVETTPAEGQGLEMYGDYASVIVEMSAPLAEQQNLANLVTLDPRPGNMYLSVQEGGKTLYISGIFQSGMAYTLTISGQLSDRWGETLERDVVRLFVAGNREPTLRVPMLWTGGNVFFTLPGETSLDAFVTNINNLDVTRAEITLEEFIDSIGIGLTTPAFRTQETWRQTLEIPANVSQPVAVAFRQDASGLQTGLYSFQINSPQLARQFDAADFRLVVSPVQLTLKESQNELFVWASNLQENQPVANRPVEVFDSSKTSIGRGQTDADGVARVPLPLDRENFTTLIAVLGEPGDADFSVATTQWSSGISPWNFGLSSRIYSTPIKAYLYTDRPIYQPGQTVYYRAVLRQDGDARYQPVDSGEVFFQMYGDYLPETGQVPLLETQRQVVSPYGTVNGSFTLPQNSRPGFYSIILENQAESRIEFQVAEYRKPEIDLEVDFALPEYKLGQDIQAAITARYFFGETARDVKVNWSLYARDDFVWMPGGYQTGLLDTSWMDPYWWMGLDSGLGRYLLGGSGQSGADGRFPLTFLGKDLEELLKDRNPTILLLEATMFDESGQPVSRRAEVRLHPADFTIGVHLDSWSIQAGASAHFDIFTADWGGQPAGEKILTGIFEKVEWVQDWSGGNGGDVSYREEATLVGSVDFRTGADGRARIAFVPDQPGTYRLDVRGSGAVTQTLVWVSGPGSAPWPQLPNQQLRLEKDLAHYQVGQTARIFIPNPFTENVLALVTVERQGVLRSQVLTLTGSSTEFELPIQAIDAPNIFVSVTLVSKRDDNRPDFRYGYTELEVDPNLLKLDVEITPQQTRLEPHATARFEIQVKDPMGNPIQGEFSLAAVDKSVLALTEANAEDIVSAFYGRQPLGVWTSMALAAYTHRLILQAPDLGGGGGGEMARVIQLRSDFQDTAYWNGSFETDSGGRALIEFPVPDNLTTWVVTVRGLTRDTKVGEAVTEVIVSKDLLIRPVTPRFLVVGDRVQLGAVVNNNSAEPLDVIVHLQASGVVLEIPELTAQAVQVAAGGRQRVNWWVTVQDAQQADLVFSVQGGGLSDSAVPVNGKLPILRYVSPQSFATSGILAEGGQQLEVVSLPRSFTPGGGELRVELSPSLVGAVFSGIDAMQTYPGGFSESTMSSLLANLAVYDLIRSGNLDAPDLIERLQRTIRNDLDSLISMQNSDGGWGWAAWHSSDMFMTSYAVLVLEQARNKGFIVDQQRLDIGLDYVKGALYPPAMTLENWELDRLAFSYYVLNRNGRTRINPTDLTGLSERLNPWAQAFLAMALKDVDPEASSELINNLQGSVIRSATGAHWQDAARDWRHFSTPLSTTAVVVYSLADFDPASPLLAEAIRYLVAHRQAGGGWMCSYDTAWIIAGLASAARATGDLQAAFAFSATLNNEPLAAGQVSGLQNQTPVRAEVSITQLEQSGNLLRFTRESGPGRLYYRAYLEVGQPVESLSAVDSGLAISRTYTLAGTTCALQECAPISGVSSQISNPVVLAHLSITVPEDTYYLVVEDFIPAGSEIVNTQLATTQLGPGGPEGEVYREHDPFADGWGWWYFNQPEIFGDHIRWVARYVPAGTYMLTYRLMPLQPGEFNVLPARAYQYYFPEVQGRSAGVKFTIE
jgi:alpha-2-macroglobulin